MPVKKLKKRYMVSARDGEFTVVAIRDGGRIMLAIVNAMGDFVVKPFRVNEIESAKRAKSKRAKKFREVLGDELDAVIEALDEQILVDEVAAEIQEEVIMPVFEPLSKIIHPTLDYMENKGYMAVKLKVIIKDEHGQRTDFKTFILTSDRRLLPTWERERLLEENIDTTIFPAVPYDRYNPVLIGEFLKGWEPDVKEIVEKTKGIIDYYMEFFLKGQLEFITAWIVGTYFFPLFPSYPYVYVYGTKRVGKTKLLTIIKLLAFNAVLGADVSTPSIYRTIQDALSTLCLDEEEKLDKGGERADALIRILRAGYKRGGKVPRVEGEKRRYVVWYRVYSPKIFANIRGIEDILADRTIPFLMMRAKGPKGDREVKMDDPIWPELRTCLALMALRHFREVREIYEQIRETPVAPETLFAPTTLEEARIFSTLTQRERELWAPILAVAVFLERHGVPVLKNLLKFLASALEEKRTIEATESREAMLICALLRNVDEDGFYPTSTIKEWVSNEIESEEPPRWLTSRWVGRALRRIGVREKRKVKNRNEWRLSPELVREIAKRYLANLPLDEELEKKLTRGPKATGVKRVGGANGATTADIMETIGTELARIAREKTRTEGGFSREWLVEQIIELAEERGLKITGERAAAVFDALLKDGHIMEKPGGDYVWIV